MLNIIHSEVKQPSQTRGIKNELILEFEEFNLKSFNNFLLVKHKYFHKTLC